MALPYGLKIRGQVIKTYYGKQDAYDTLLRLAQELGIECKVVWDRKTEIKATIDMVNREVLIEDNGKTEVWKLMIGRSKPLKGDALARAVYKIIEGDNGNK